ncbi:MAG: pantoate--beta-alanine ligase [Candidatus Omnitrophica bacterium]|nr:pantoate--beta-alanine ligase [Candidatus Omnitrophota bacterium]
MATVYLGIGSNIGDKEVNCREAVRRLGETKNITILESSTFYITKPVGGPRQEDYLNGVVKVGTRLAPEDCLDAVKKVEEEMGRVPAGKDHPRIIDVDILLYDDVVLKQKRLTIPHPRMHEREFALKGLVEVAPRATHPIIGKTMEELYKSCVCGKNKKSMKIIKNIREMEQYSREAKAGTKTIGFVPTMGYLHDGHVSLVKAARAECDVVVLSVYVNPTQFGRNEDLSRYPRDMKGDERLSEENGVDVMFVPTDDAMYPDGYNTFVEVDGPLANVLCGASRPGHFRGVATVVAKLFNIIDPDISYFGQKDAQQAAVVKRMVKDLDMGTEIRVMPTIREEDGLAMSSRNSYLSPSERRRAASIFRAFKKAEELIKGGKHDVFCLKEEIEKVLIGQGDLNIDYIELVDAESLQPLDVVRGEVKIMVAVYLDKVRLIDNVAVTVKNVSQ